MTSLRAQDRLQPALLDRLTDDEPASALESAESRVINKARLRAMVLRDLAWLFNTTRSETIDAEAAPQAARSVLGFGLPPLAGRTASSLDPSALEERVRQAILAFEPRILPDSLRVEAVVTERQLDHHNQMGFVISGHLWAQPVPLELLLHTDIDLESGRVEVKEGRR
jgi:type VI secretion system protein ImpF